jgi:L-lysine exporter family protein LysE/ArgO
VYGALAFRAALRPGSLHAEQPAGTSGAGTLSAALATTLAVSLLNPHVYLDTVVLLGGVAAQYPPDERVAFVLGAGIASAVWFFGLALGARLLTPVFERPVAWRVLDVVIGCIMWWIAAGLIFGQIAA